VTELTVTGPTVSNPRHTVSVIKGEDAAPEAVDATLGLLRAIDAALDFTFPLVGATSGASGIALFYLRFGKETFANVRPAKTIPGANSLLSNPDGIDFVVVRENLEGLYCGIEGDLSDLSSMTFTHPLGGPLQDRDGMFSLKIVTPQGSERIARFAFELADSRNPDGGGHVTVRAKHNVLRADSLFVEAARTVSEDFPEVAFHENFIDNLARRMVAEPHALDVVLVPNFAGDIASDVAAGVIGGLGMMPSGCYGAHAAYFEPPHGTAPDLVGLGTINPTAQMLSAAMMLDHLGEPAHARTIRRAIATVFAESSTLPRDQRGNASTAEFTSAVITAAVASATANTNRRAR
jgi:isocitrate/isopropylmalate dehydrogenase